MISLIGDNQAQSMDTLNICYVTKAMTGSVSLKEARKVEINTS